MPETRTPRKPVSPGEVDLIALWVSGLSIVDFLILDGGLPEDCGDRARGYAPGAEGLTDDELDLVHAIARRCDRESRPYTAW